MCSEIGFFPQETHDFDLMSCYPTSSATILDVDFLAEGGVIERTINNRSLSLDDIVNDALADPRSVDRASFEQVLAEQEVRLAVTNRDGWSFKMRREDSGKIGRKKASALCPDFTADKASEVFKAHAQQAQQATPALLLQEEDKEEEQHPRAETRIHPKDPPPRGTTAAERWRGRLPEVVGEEDELSFSL